MGKNVKYMFNLYTEHLQLKLASKSGWLAASFRKVLFETFTYLICEFYAYIKTVYMV